MTQCERLLKEFEKGRELTMWEILHELRIGNHTGRISDLRAKGYDIDDIGKKGFGVYKMRGKKCNEKPSVNAAIGNPITDRQTDFAPGITESHVTAKSLLPLKWYGYKCKKGHIDHWHGSDPPKEVRCAFCNWQEHGSLIT